MRANRRIDTRPEKRIRSALHASGLRYRKDVLLKAGDLKVHVDIVFPRQRLAVFVDGCFWHGCPEHGLAPRANAAYWLPKLEANRRRDSLVDKALQETGWIVVRFWEHVQVEAAVAEISELLRIDDPFRP